MSAPRWTAALLRWLAPQGRGDELIGDLEEVHRRRVRHRGRLVGGLLTSLDALDMAFALVRARRRATVRGIEPADDSSAGSRRSPTFSWLDLKLGARMLVRYPGLTVVGGLAIAFAIWVGAATFEFASQVLYPTLPLPEGERVVGIQMKNTETGGSEGRLSWDFVRLRENVRSMEEIGAFQTVQHNLAVGAGLGEPVDVARITPSGFDVARVPPHMGRTLGAGDGAPGAPPVVVIGYDAWRTHFAADPWVVGTTVRLGTERATVVGVMPEGFGFPVAHAFWVPLRQSELEHEPRQGPGLTLFGRLAPGVTVEEAQAELTILGRQASTAFPDTHEHLRPQVLPFGRAVLGLPKTISAGAFLFTNVFLLMLVVLICGNVALLMFARAATRANEIVVRSALGASRRRIVGQLFAEALVLGGVAAVAGLAAADYGLGLILAIVEAEFQDGGKLPFWISADLSPATYLYAACLTMVAAAVAGIIPALKMTGSDTASRLRATGSGSGGPRFGGIWTAVIIGQVAVMVAFPATAWFMHRSMTRIENFDVGFPEEEYLSAKLELDVDESGVDAAETGGPERMIRVVREMEERLELDPAVASVTVATRLARMYHPWKQVEVDEGAVAPPDERGHRVSNASIALDYLETLQNEVVSGRGFAAGDLDPDARAVLVNHSFVEKVLGGKNAVGRRIRYLDSDWWEAEARTAEDWYEIVGVTPDLAMTSGYGQAGIYHPLATAAAQPLYLAIHVRGEPEAFASRLREVAAAVDPTLRLSAIVPIDELDADQLFFFEFWLRLVLIVAAIALLLALTGIYSVMSFRVSRRTREIGVRVALGAPAGRVVASIFARPLLQMGIGVILGAVWVALLAAVHAGSMGAMGGQTFSPWTGGALVASYATFMMGVCLLACVAPTRRALAVEPTEALRAEG